MNTRGTRLRNGRKKVKSGCITCKIRKVKCDEGRPACQKCVSTGRVCDGYGIWGGGGTSTDLPPSQGQTKVQRIPAPPAASVVDPTAKPVEKALFEWFCHRTTPKLPGSFICDFWSTLILRTSVSEPAVWHAVLALSSVHRSGSTCIDSGGMTQKGAIKRQEHLTLHHYVKSINNLQSHLLVQDRASLRVALITCIALISVELLREHIQTAQLHFKNGLKIIQAMQLNHVDGDGPVKSTRCAESADEWILEVFSRLYLQTGLMNYAHGLVGHLLPINLRRINSGAFHCFNDAWREIDWIFNQIFSLSKLARDKSFREGELDPFDTDLFKKQQHILNELVRWFDHYQVFVKGRGLKHPEAEKAYQLLGPYHSMARIMAFTSLCPDDEMQYDLYDHHFTHLIQQSARIHPLGANDIMGRATQERQLDVSRSIIDLGWIPPLYFAAVKCRVHHIRLEAIRCLEMTFHREGIWDSRTAACIASKIMAVEEQGFYDGVDMGGDILTFSETASPRSPPPPLPENHRVYEWETGMEGTPLNRIRLSGKRKLGGLGHETVHSEYDMHSQQWTDAKLQVI